MYYYNDGENEVGPFNLEKLRTIRQSGLIGDGTLVRRSGSGSWAPFGQVGALEDARGPGATVEGEAAEPDEPAPQGDVAARERNWTQGLARPGDAAAAPAEPAAAPESAAAALESASGWLAYPPTPWRRYAARVLDTTLNGVVGAILLGIGFFAVAPATAASFFASFDSGAGPLLDLILTAVLASIIGGALIGVTGFTLGKLIFGVKVTRLDGAKPGLAAGLSRDFSVLFRGLGLGVPIIALFTLWFSYRRLASNTKTAWDEGRYIVWHRPSGSAQYLLNLIGIVLIVLLAGIAVAISEI